MPLLVPFSSPRPHCTPPAHPHGLLVLNETSYSQHLHHVQQVVSDVHYLQFLQYPPPLFRSITQLWGEDCGIELSFRTEHCAIS